MPDTEFSSFVVDVYPPIYVRLVWCLLVDLGMLTHIRNLRSASVSELHLKVVSPDRDLGIGILPQLKDPVSVSVELETV
jgi:hypothetical protein